MYSVYFIYAIIVAVSLVTEVESQVTAQITNIVLDVPDGPYKKGECLSYKSSSDFYITFSSRRANAKRKLRIESIIWDSVGNVDRTVQIVKIESGIPFNGTLHMNLPDACLCQVDNDVVINVKTMIRTRRRRVLRERTHGPITRTGDVAVVSTSKCETYNNGDCWMEKETSIYTSKKNPYVGQAWGLSADNHLTVNNPSDMGKCIAISHRIADGSGTFKTCTRSFYVPRECKIKINMICEITVAYPEKMSLFVTGRWSAKTEKTKYWRDKYFEVRHKSIEVIE